MPEIFDPYYTWLGIPPKDQPPHLYRLLGVDLLESNADVIANAADQRMAHLRSFQTGSHAASSQKILNEIAAARVCLLNPSKKAMYDQQLQQQLAGVPSAPATEESFLDGVSAYEPPKVTRINSRSNPAWFFLGVGGVSLVVMAGLLLLLRHDDKKVAASDPGSVKSAVVETIAPTKRPVSPKPMARPEAPKTEPVAQPPKPAAPKLTLLEDPNSLPEVEAPMVVAKIESEPKPKPQAKQWPEPTRQRLPIPDNAAQQKSLASIRDIYKDDYNKADMPALAVRLFRKANETQETIDRFALLQEAKNLAIDNGQGKLAFDVIDSMAGEYNVSRQEMKVDAIQEAAKKPHITPEQKTAMAALALRIVDESVAEDNFDVAKKAGRLANQLARLSRNKELIQNIAAKGKQVVAAAKAYADVQEAMATLKEKPDDPDANLTIGKYHCFNKGEWDDGLPMLAKGSDVRLRALAEKDNAGAASADEQVKLGDAWWDVARERAVYWYSKALPGLTGLEKDRVENRVAKKVAGSVVDKVLKKIDRLVIWNEHNSIYNNDGTEVCSVVLVRGGKEVWRLNELRIPWKENEDTFLAVPVPRIGADTVRVEITRWHGVSGGLSEIQVFSAKNNIALGCEVTASVERPPFLPNALTDGITTSADHEKGYWILPDGRKGWAEIHLTRRDHDDSDLSCLVGTWDIEAGSYHAKWVFAKDGSVISTSGNPKGSWVAERSAVKITWSSGQMDSLRRPLNPQSTQGDSHAGVGIIRAKRAVK